MKDILAGLAVVLILACLFYLVYNTFSQRKITKKNVDVIRPMMPNFDLGYYVGIPNTRSPRFVAPLRPNVYRPIPLTPTMIPRPRRRIRRVFV
jgi:hypothetical protein